MKTKKIIMLASILIILGLLIAIINKENVNCNSYSIDECPNECVICPPCEYCSSISCQTEEFCASIGFDKNWYGTYVVK